MTGILKLYLRGSHFHETEISMPTFDKQLSFEENVEIRESYVRHQSEKMRIMYLRQILKCQNDYSIVLFIKSKVNEMEQI